MTSLKLTTPLSRVPHFWRMEAGFGASKPRGATAGDRDSADHSCVSLMPVPGKSPESGKGWGSLGSRHNKLTQARSAAEGSPI